MKKNIEKALVAEKPKTARPKVSGKKGLLAVLMFLLATKGWSEERWAVVLRHLDTGDNHTEVLLDKNGDGRPDLSITLSNSLILHLLLKDELAVGTTVSYEDKGEMPTQLPYIFPSSLISIEGRNILELFDDPSYFRAAFEKHLADLRNQRGSR